VARKGQGKHFDKYELYRKAVQSPESDVIFLRKVYRELRNSEPRVLREDFCGTFALSCEWVKLNPRYEAYGIDLDPEPLEYGRAHYLEKLKDDQKRRLHLIEGNVLEPGLPTADLVIAMNFSYFVFKTREVMRAYFAHVHKSLRPRGLFVMDLFGGSLCYDANEEKTVHRGFTYYWDQEGFDPVTNRAKFHIHFRIKGKPKQERVFTYDWRMWSIPELREILREAGFEKSHVYWEGTTAKGEGDGVFRRTEKGEACQSWIAYIAAEK
jgi:SAM-dependent methyltransferase